MKWKGYQERKAAKKNKLAEMDLIWAKALAIKSGNLEVSNTEEQAFKEAYDSPLEDYMEVVIQYGYIVMFSASFPLAPLIALIAGIIELRVDGYKLTDIVRRPLPSGSSGIGNWLQILRFLSFVGIFTNATIIVFTSTMVQVDELETKWFLWLIIINVLYVIKESLAYFIPDAPASHKQIEDWHIKTVNQKIYKKVLDMDKRRENQQLFMKGPNVAKTKFKRNEISVVNRQAAKPTKQD